MSKKSEEPFPSDMFGEKECLQGLITVFREALKGDKNAVKVAHQILDGWQAECDRFSDDDVSDFDSDDSMPFLPATLKRPDVSEYHLRIKLNHVSVKIWRELKVPSNIGLAFLGHLLVEMMGWKDEHLFHFLHDNIFYDDQESVDMSFRGNVKLISDYTLSDLLKAKGDKMMLEYDFGDCWRHDIWVKGIRPYEKGERQCVKFVKGQGACPPEDCGGVPGYEHLLEIRLKKQKDAEEKEELRWYGIRRNYDPDAFDSEYGEAVAEDYNLLMLE